MFCASNFVDDIMERMGQNQRQRVCFIQFSSWLQCLPSPKLIKAT